MELFLRKKAVFLLFGFFLSASLQALGSNDGFRSEPLVIYAIKGSSGVGLIRLFDDPPKLRGFDVRVEALSQADLVASRFISGEAKVGILPPNIAAKIASSGRDIRAAAVTGTGMLSLLSSDSSIRSIADLRAKTVEVAGQGATPDYVFRKILSASSLVPDRDLRLGYSLPYPEIAQALISGRVSLALLPEPFASMALMGKPDLFSVADIQEEWAKIGGAGNYPMTLLVVDGAFAASNPEAIGEILLSVKDSIDWVKAHPADAGELTEKYELGIRADAASAAIPKSNYVFIPAAEARPSLEALFRVFLENSHQSIGGALPGDSFYLK